ncbi:MAG: DNA recombination protein RmuC [Deltaproteobacteria bacterium]|nr:DNA recombination protein RmuC [Deltaproteobacteria bacterium]
MEPLPLAITLVVGLATGWAAGWLVGRARRGAESAAESAELRARLDERSARAASLEADLDRRTRELADLGAARARLAAELEGERRTSGEKLALLAAAERQLREAFQSLSAEALRQNNQSFLDLAKAALGEFQRGAVADLDTRRQAIGDLVQPVRESLEKVDLKLAAVERDRVDAYASLREQVRSLAQTQQQLHAETAKLVRALRTPSVRGRWGEIQLKRVVELAGMLDHCDFFEQPSVTTEDGRLRPDLLVKLPGGRNVVVDAKAPLGAFLEAFEASDESVREARLRDHARQVREHMTKLGAKSYAAQFEPAPEFVVMFLPGEAFFSAALQYDPELIEFGVDKRVIPASPTTLIALLRAVAYGWRHERLAENAQAISELGRELHERLRTMAEHFERLGGQLDRAVAAYNDAIGSIERRVLVTARRLKEKGIGVTEEIPALEGVERSARALGALAGDPAEGQTALPGMPPAEEAEEES